MLFDDREAEIERKKNNGIKPMNRSDAEALAKKLGRKLKT
jgi:hypothetical protein